MLTCIQITVKLGLDPIQRAKAFERDWTNYRWATCRNTTNGKGKMGAL